MEKTGESPDRCDGYAKALRAAAEAGLTAAELEEVLDLRIGPEPKERLRDLLDGREEIVLAQIRLRGRLTPTSASRKVPFRANPFVT